MKLGINSLPFVVFVIVVALPFHVSAQTGIRDTEVVKKLSISQKRELNGVFPLKTRKYLLGAKSLFVTETRSKRTIEVTDLESNRGLLDSLFLDTANAKNVRDTCRTPEYWIQTESGSRAQVIFSISYGCNDVTGSGVDFHLIQGRIDGKNNRSKVILQALFQPVVASTRSK